MEASVKASWRHQSEVWEVKLTFLFTYQNLLLLYEIPLHNFTYTVNAITSVFCLSWTFVRHAAAKAALQPYVRAETQTSESAASDWDFIRLLYSPKQSKHWLNKTMHTMLINCFYWCIWCWCFSDSCQLFSVLSLSPSCFLMSAVFTEVWENNTLILYLSSNLWQTWQQSYVIWVTQTLRTGLKNKHCCVPLTSAHWPTSQRSNCLTAFLYRNQTWLFTVFDL